MERGVKAINYRASSGSIDDFFEAYFQRKQYLNEMTGTELNEVYDKLVFYDKRTSEEDEKRVFTRWLKIRFEKKRHPLERWATDALVRESMRGRGRREQQSPPSRSERRQKAKARHMRRAVISSSERTAVSTNQNGGASSTGDVAKAADFLMEGVEKAMNVAGADANTTPPNAPTYRPSALAFPYYNGTPDLINTATMQHAGGVMPGTQPSYPSNGASFSQIHSDATAPLPNPSSTMMMGNSTSSSDPPSSPIFGDIAAPLRTQVTAGIDSNQAMDAMLGVEDAAASEHAASSSAATTSSMSLAESALLDQFFDFGSYYAE